MGREVEKLCSKCKKIKPLSEFYLKPDGSLYKVWCKSCFHKQAKEWKRNNLSQHKLNQRSRKLKKNYGITIEEYNKLYLDQQGKCKICGIPQNLLIKHLSIDHDHNTGVIRGLLCSNCNSHLGWYETFKNDILRYLNND